MIILSRSAALDPHDACAGQSCVLRDVFVTIQVENLGMNTTGSSYLVPVPEVLYAVVELPLAFVTRCAPGMPSLLDGN